MGARDCFQSRYCLYRSSVGHQTLQRICSPHVGWLRNYGFTTKDALLVSVPPGVVTWTVPLVAPVGTVVVISDAETTVKVAAVRLKVTLVAPVRSVPRMVTLAPTWPKAGVVVTKGPSP